MITIDTLKTFRQNFGLSQYEAATLLGTTRSQINMAEKGIRPVPMDVGIRLLELTEHVKVMPGEERKTINDSNSANNQNDLLLSELDEQLKIIRFQLSVITARLNCFDQKQENLIGQSRKREGLINVLKQQQVDTDFLHMRGTNKQKELSGCNENKKIRLQLQRDLLLAKANVISQYLDNGKS
jgi:transcriptional regulator with XRE-family HTH domain